MPDAPEAAPAADNRPLDDVMLAMDVVDTLRHREQLVQRELSADQRDQQLIERLREIYAQQGIQVPDHVLAEGVRALQEDRFTYSPPAVNWQVRLARLYVHRARWIRRVALVLAVVAIAAAAYVLLVALPRQWRTRSALEELQAHRAAVVQEAKQVEAADQAGDLYRSGQAAIQAGNIGAAREYARQLKTLRETLEREYDLRIVTQGSTGVWRVPDVNPEARNYYIIVQPIDPDGRILTMPVRSEEDGKVASVNQWGLRVDESTFWKVAADKKDDGIIQNDLFGVKRKGYLKPEYLMPTTGGAITSW